MSALPKCNYDHPDCFARRCFGDKALCSCLRDTRFKGNECPFYKSVDQVMIENPNYFNQEVRR